MFAPLGRIEEYDMNGHRADPHAQRIGALTGRVRTELGPGWIALRSEHESIIHSTQISGSAAVLEQTLGSLISCALASGEPSETLPLLLMPEPPTPTPDGHKIFAIAASMVEADTLPLFGLKRRQDGGFVKSMQAEAFPGGAIAALIALEQRYAARLRLLAMDRAHWAALRARAPLIDWSLLVMHAAMRRRPRVVNEILDLFGPKDEIRRFLSEIAEQFR